MPDMDRPANLPHGRWLGDFGELSALETKLVAACARGEFCAPDDWDGERPDEETDANRVRADVIRFLALGGDAQHPVHERGIMLGGAWVTGRLDLLETQIDVRIFVRKSHFPKAPCLVGARLSALALPGSRVAGLDADGVRVGGDIFLNSGFVAHGEVRLPGARIDGDFDCSGGTFENAQEAAIIGDRIKVNGGVFLRDGFCSTGEVRLLNAEVGGGLICSGAVIENLGAMALSADGLQVKGGVFLNSGFTANGEVRLPRACIGGDLECSKGRFRNLDGRALNAEGMEVGCGLIVRDAAFEGTISLSAARIGTLLDDGACWGAGNHDLDGLHYDRIAGVTGAAERIAWLKQQRSQHLTSDFRPQPWEQLIRVLREMGHPHEASEVAIEKQRMMRQAGVIKGWYRRVPHRIYGLLAGYGYRPIWTVGWMLGACAAFGAAFTWGEAQGYVAPTDPLIHLNPALVEKCGVPLAEATRKESPHVARAHWTSPDCPTPAEYTTFNPWFYSLDLILPLVDLQQERDWAPAVVDPAGRPLWWGAYLRWMMWFEILFGWGTSLMLVAVLGRLVEKD